jgi:hypothetical protein
MMRTPPFTTAPPVHGPSVPSPRGGGRTAGRIGARAATAVLATLAVVLANPGVASANWSIQDGFEGSPSGTWKLQHSGTGSGGFEINQGTANRGQNNAWLRSQTGWSAVGKNLLIGPAANNRFVRCNAAFVVSSLTGASQLNVEVIDPSTWNYLAVKTVTVSSTSYVTVGTDSWHAGASPNPVYVRISLLGNGSTTSTVRVDDMNVVCWVG